MSLNEPESDSQSRGGLPKTRPIARQASAEPSATFLPPSPSDSLKSYANLAAHCVGCSMAWVDLSASRYSSYMSETERNAKDANVTLNDIRRSLFNHGNPNDLSINPDAVIYCAAGESSEPLHLFVISCPIILGGNRFGQVVAASRRVRKVSTEQIESFRMVAKVLSGQLTSQKPPQHSDKRSGVSLNTAQFLSNAGAAWILDSISRRILAVGDDLVKMLGYDEAELFALQSCSELLVSSISQRSGNIDERRLKCRDGAIVTVAVTAIPVEFEGSPAVLESFHDVTPLHDLQIRDSLHISALNHVSDAVIGLDTNLRITYWNDAAERMYGWRAANVIGEKLDDIVQPVWVSPDAERVVTTAMLASGAWEGEITHHHRNGSSISVHCVATAIKVTGQSTSEGFTCVNRDITHTRQIESSLAVSQVRYQSLFYANPDAVLSLDDSGKIVGANYVAERVFGLSSSLGFPANLASIASTSDLSGVLACFDRAILGETIPLDFVGLNSHSVQVYLSSVFLPVTVNGRIDGVYLIAKDIGDIKRQQAIISAENAAMQKLLSQCPLDDVIEQLISQISDSLQDVQCTVALLSQGSGAENPLKALPVKDFARGKFPRFTELELASPQAKAILTTSRQLHIADSDPDDHSPMRFAARSICSVPIVDAKGTSIGSFSLLLRHSRPPLLDEIRIAERAASILAIAFEADKITQRLALTERAIDTTLAAVVIVDPTKSDHPIIYANKSFEKVTQYSPDEALGKSLGILRGSETDSDLSSRIDIAIDSGQEFQALIKYHAKDGSVFWSSSSVSPVASNTGEITHAVEVINDVTAVMNAMLNLRSSEERFRQLVEHASDIIIVLETSGAIRYASPAIERVLGYSFQDVMGAKLIEYLHPDDLPNARHLFSRILESTENARSIEVRAQRKDGSWCYVEATMQNLIDTGGIGAIVVNARDLSERKSASDQLDHLAFYDPLTDLPNRMLFTDRLGRAIVDARRSETMVAVMFLDVNRFKIINDSLGHAAGDALLKQIGQRLVSTAREGDTVARWGNDEFALIFTNVASTRDASRVAQRIINSTSEPFELEGKEIFSTVSIGISMFPSAGDNSEILLRCAGVALHRAKEQPQSNHQFYSDKMNAGGSERVALESSLRRAVERNEFELYYQPQIDVKSGKIVSAEALVRWHHPEQGMVPPGSFIPLAEETGLIVPMGDWIMRQACDESKRLREAGYDGFRVAVNLSAKQFAQRDLHQNVLRILRESGADPTALELELTESLLLNGEDRVVAAMNDLTAIGVTVSIDDFGIGYASYSYLRRYPVKTLKIDQSFVKGMLTNSHDNVIVQSIVSMAHTIGLNVVAEGVETADQRDALISTGCDILQGYFYGKPMPISEFTELLSRHKLDDSSTRKRSKS